MRNSTLCIVLVLLMNSTFGQMQITNSSLIHLVKNTFDFPIENLPEAELRKLSPLGAKAHDLYVSSYINSDKSHPTKNQNGIWIEEDGQIYQYRNKQLFQHGRKLNNRSKDLRKLHGHLVKIEEKSSYGQKIIKALQTSENQFLIKISTCRSSYMVVPINMIRKGILNNNAYAFQIMDTHELVVEYAAFDKIGSGAEIRWNPKCKLINLAHELAHAYDANYGLMDDRLMMVGGEAMLKREVRAIYHENNIRKELGKSLRRSVHGVKMQIVDNEPITYPLPYTARH